MLESLVALSLQSRIRLNNDVEMPILGLGVFRASPTETRQAVRTALELGYRHVDTARVYGNEADVGAAIRECPIPRDEIFVTTKLWNADQGYDATLRAFEDSLERLGLDRVDLYLIHWPIEGLRSESYRAMQRLLKDGRCRAIGVSNYTTRHLEELLRTAEVVPTINQVEFHPYLYQRELLEFCRRHRIQIEAYSPLTKGIKLAEPVLVEMAARYGKTTAQILIRWGLQHDLVVIPKSVHPGRIRENADVFDLSISPVDMARLDSLNENFRTSWDPTDVP